MDHTNQTSSFISDGEFTSQHLQEESSIAVDVHLGGLLARFVGFRGRIGWIARTFCLQLLEKINGTIIRDFGSPFVARDGLKEDISTADVTMDDGVRPHQVEVVEGSGHIQTYGDD